MQIIKILILNLHQACTEKGWFMLKDWLPAYHYCNKIKVTAYYMLQFLLYYKIWFSHNSYLIKNINIHLDETKKLTFLKARSLIASVTARHTTYCTWGTTRPSSICIVNEKRRLPFGDSHIFCERPVIDI